MDTDQQIMSAFTILPPTAQRRITASVGFVSPLQQPGKYVIIQNKRGWDIPGGHVEGEESPIETFGRELKEETSCILLPGAKLIAVLEGAKHPHTGIAVFRAFCEVGHFTPHEEISALKVVSKQELLEAYFGDKELLGQLLDLAA